MYRSTILLLTLIFCLVAIDLTDETHKPIPVKVEVEHWKIDDHYTHTITFRADTLEALKRSLNKYHPYIYRSKIEIRFATDNMNEYEAKFEEIEQHLRNDFPNW